MSPARRRRNHADAHTATRKLVRTSGSVARAPSRRLVLVLPVVVMAMLAVVQIGLVAHQYLVVWHAARELARAAAVAPDQQTALNRRVGGRNRARPGPADGRSRGRHLHRRADHLVAHLPGGHRRARRRPPRWRRHPTGGGDHAGRVARPGSTVKTARGVRVC